MPLIATVLIGREPCDKEVKLQDNIGEGNVWLIYTRLRINKQKSQKWFGQNVWQKH